MLALLALALADLPPGAVAVSGSPRLPLHHFTLSPDGRRLAGVDSRRASLASLDGGPLDLYPVPAPLPSADAHAVWPADGDLCWVTYWRDGFCCLARRPDGTVVAPAGLPPKAPRRLLQARLTPDGKEVLTAWATDDPAAAAVEVWPFEAGKSSRELAPVRTLAVKTSAAFGLRGVVVSNDASHLLTGTGGQITAVSLATGKPAWELSTPAGVGTLFRGVASADGKTVVVAHFPERGRFEVSVWDGPVGRQLRVLPGAERYSRPAGRREGPWRVQLTPDGKRLVILATTADHRMEGVVLDVAGGGRVAELVPQPGGATGGDHFSLSGDGRRLAHAGSGATAVWDLASGAEVRVGGGHRGPVRSLVFSKDGEWVLSAGQDRLVRCWSAATGQERWAISVPVDVTLPGLTPDGQGVLVNSDRLIEAARATQPRAVRVADGKPLDLPPRLTDRKADLVAFSPSGQTVAAVTATGFQLSSWPAGLPVKAIPFEPLPDFPGRNGLPPTRDMRFGMSQVRFSADARELVGVAMHSMPPGVGHNPHRVERYEVSTGKLLSVVPVTINKPTLVTAFGRLAVLAIDQPDPAGPPLLDAITGAEVGRLARPNLPNWGWGQAILAAAPPDNRRLLLLTTDGVHVFDPATGDHRGQWPPAARPVTALAVSRDGRRVATGGPDGVCVVWDAERHLP